MLARSKTRRLVRGPFQGERGAIRDLVEAEEYKHLSLRSLALLGKRIGKVFASYETWSRLVREHGWRRPRRRLYPAKRKVGIRATAPNEWWHVDVTIIRLLDGTRTYLHAVVDNYSRRVVAWTLDTRLSAAGTRKILGEARQALTINRAVSCGRCTPPRRGPPTSRLSIVRLDIATLLFGETGPAQLPAESDGRL